MRVQLSGKICLLDVEMDGVKNLRKSGLKLRFVSIRPPSFEELVSQENHRFKSNKISIFHMLFFFQEKRLRSRGTESEASIQTRLKRAKVELDFSENSNFFDMVVVNDDLEESYNQLKRYLLEVRKLRSTHFLCNASESHSE